MLSTIVNCALNHAYNALWSSLLNRYRANKPIKKNSIHSPSPSLLLIYYVISFQLAHKDRKTTSIYGNVSTMCIDAQFIAEQKKNRENKSLKLGWLSILNCPFVALAYTVRLWINFFFCFMGVWLFPVRSRALATANYL